MLRKTFVLSLVFLVFINSGFSAIAAEINSSPREVNSRSNIIPTVRDLSPQVIDLPASSSDIIPTVRDLSPQVIDLPALQPIDEILRPTEGLPAPLNTSIDSSTIPLDSTITDLTNPPNTINENVPAKPDINTPQVQVAGIIKKLDNQSPQGKNFKLQTDNNTGALVASYPINAPSGRNSIQPDLSLNYNSQNHNGDNIFGYGWSINIPYIERINKDGVDKMYNENNYSSTLSGDLKDISLPDFVHGVFGAKVEDDRFLKYEYKKDNYWEVTDKNGLTYLFGSSSQARQDDPNNNSKIFKWMLEEIRDKNDNFIKYSYFKYDGQIYPSYVMYTGHGNSSGDFYVKFSIDYTKTRTDVNISYKAGFKVKTELLIDSVVVGSGYTNSIQYQIEYITGDNGSRSLLSKITKKNAFAGKQSLPSDQFIYQKNYAINWEKNSNYTVPVDLYNGYTELSGARIFDVNGDSLPDIVFAKVGQPKEVYINKGNNNGWKIDPDYIVPVYFVSKIGDDMGVRIADINGDNLPDFLESSQSPINGNIYINKGIEKKWDFSGKIPSDVYFISVNLVDTGVRVADVNGDNLDDIILTTPGVYLNKGNNNWELSNYSVYTKTVPPGVLVDVNGDGLIDVIWSQEGGGKAVFINTGYDWQQDSNYTVPVYFSKKWGSDNGARIGDANGDGLPDIFYANGGEDISKWGVYINKGDGSGWEKDLKYTIPEAFINSADNGVRLTDVNGDGISDFVVKNQTLNNAVYISPAINSDLLGESINSKGGLAKINYLASAQYQDPSGNSLNPKLPFTIPLVKKIMGGDGFANTSSTYYEYQGGEYYYKNSLDRKFAGFAQINQKNDQGYLTKDYYHQGNDTNESTGEFDPTNLQFNDDPFKIGKLFATEKYDEKGNLYAKTFQRWEATSLGTDRRFVRSSQKIDISYDGNATAKAKAEKYSYDLNNGNLIKKISMGEVNASSGGQILNDIGNDQLNTDIQYTTDSKIKLSLPATEVTQNQNSTIIKQIQNFYDELNLLSATKGNLTKQSSWISGNKYTNTTRAYNDFGLVTKETDQLGHTTLYEYGDKNLYPTKITNSLSQSENFIYDYFFGKPIQYTDVNGNKFTISYDVFGRPLQTKEPDPVNSSNLVTNTEFSYYDNQFPSSILRIDRTTANNGKQTYSYFDGYNRLIQSRTSFDDQGNFAVKDYKYNKLGLSEKESLPYSSKNSANTLATTNGNLYIQYAYDALNRIKTVQNSVGTTTYGYDDWKTTINDAENNQRVNIQDAYGNLIKVIENNEGKQYMTNYEYNGLRKLTKITDALSNIQNFNYDGLGRRINAEDLHSQGDKTFGIHTYSYDDANNLLSETDQNAQTINYSYDNLNRILMEDFAGQSGVETAYTYDSCPIGIGKLCFVTSSNIITSYSYDSLGNIITEDKKIDGVDYFTKFTYDWQGNTLSLIYPDNTQINYIYESSGKLKSIKNGNNYIIKNIDYSPTGVVIKTENTNGSIENNNLDSNQLYRLTSKSTTLGKSIQNISYIYDKVGNIKQIIDSSNPTLSKTANYQYDNLYRLKSANITNAGNNQNYSQNFKYDVIGNISSKTGKDPYFYNGNIGNSYATPHAVTNIGATVFNYDKNGNILSDSKQNYIFDYHNRIVESSAPGIGMKYFYDHSGQRIKKSDGKNWSIYVGKFYEVNNDKTIKNIYAGEDKLASIEIGQVTPPNPDITVYEDAEDGKNLGWVAYAKNSTILNGYDNSKQSKIITFQNPLFYGGFKLLKDDGSLWNNKINKFFSFDFNSKNNVQFALIVDTNQGQKYLEYNSIVAKSQAKNNYIYIKLDASLLDGNWHTIERDLQADISNVSPGTTLNNINYLQVWWMGNYDNIKVDNIKLMKYSSSTPSPQNPPVTVTKTIYHHLDHLSGSNIDTDETGNVIEMTDYYPFGEVRVDQTTGNYKNDYKFTGKELDPETNLYYYGARYYSADIGRFMSQDSWEGELNNPQSLNKYSYVTNNPLKYVDPTGKSLVLVFPDPLGGQLPSNNVCLGCDGMQNNYKDVNYGKIGPLPEPTSGEKTMYMIIGGLGISGVVSEIVEGVILIQKVVESSKATNNAEKPIIIGETMKRVIKAAEETGADYYKPTTKNPENYMKNNRSWIQRKINEGREIIDIGRDSEKIRNNEPVGKYYKMEKTQLKNKNYPVKNVKTK